MNVGEHTTTEPWHTLGMETQDQLVKLAMRGEGSALTDEMQKYIAANHIKSLFDGVWHVDELNHDGNRPVRPRRPDGLLKSYLGSYNPYEDGWLDF